MKYQFFKFAAVGILSTLIHSLTYLISMNLFSLTAQLSNGVGFSTALITSYIGHRLWTFKDHKSSGNFEKLKFLLSALCSYFLNAYWVYLTTEQLYLKPEYALVGIIFITPPLTFLVLKIWVFSDEQSERR